MLCSVNHIKWINKLAAPVFSYCSHKENNLLWGQISFTAQESSEILLEELQILKQENGNHPYIYWDEQKAFGKVLTQCR